MSSAHASAADGIPEPVDVDASPTADAPDALHDSYGFGISHWFRSDMTATRRAAELPALRARLSALAPAPEHWCGRFYHAAEMSRFVGCDTLADLTSALEPWEIVARGAQLPFADCRRLCEDVSRGSHAHLAAWVAARALPLLGPHLDAMAEDASNVLVRNAGPACETEGALLFLVGRLVDAGASAAAPLRVADAAMEKWAAQSADAAAGLGPDGKRFMAAARLKTLLLGKGAAGAGGATGAPP